MESRDSTASTSASAEPGPSPAATSHLNASSTTPPTPPEDTGEDCPACAALSARERKKKGRSGAQAVQWIGCDRCETWYHWPCVATNPLDSPDLIDKYFCADCIAETPTLETTFRPPPRRTTRPSSRLDYANLDAHLPADSNRWVRVLETRNCTNGNELLKTLENGETFRDWVWGEEGMKEPVIVNESKGLGMKMPNKEIGIQDISAKVGPKTPLEVIDVASQSSLQKWTLQQWAEYYNSPPNLRDKVRNVISLEVSDSPLSADVEAPEVVREIDWVEQFWPANMKGPGQYPRVQKYCLMSVARCWTDWHIDFAGSSVYYHILRGAKIFYFIRPTKENLAKYEEWSGSTEKQENVWLGDWADEVIKVELTEGNTMIIPTGWIHAVYTPLDSLVFGGNFLHSLSIPVQLRVYAIELATKVPKKFRFPHFVKLCWFVGHAYHAALTASPPSTFPLPVDEKPTPPSRSLPTPPRILDSLLHLSSFLIDQASRMPKDVKGVSVERRRVARENVPWDRVKDPEGLARALRKAVLRRLGREEDEECFPRPISVLQTEADGVGAKKRKESPEKEKAGVKKVKVDGGMPTLKVEKEKERRERDRKKDEGEIISRSIVPVPVIITQEIRQLPDSTDPRMAEVRTSSSTNEVVRKHVEEDGTVVLETRSVVTKIERVTFLPPAPRSSASSTQTSHSPEVDKAEMMDHDRPRVMDYPMIDTFESLSAPRPPPALSSTYTHGGHASLQVASSRSISNLLPPPLKDLFPEIKPLLPAGGRNGELFRPNRDGA